MTEIQLLTKELLPALQDVVGVVERKHNIPILSHVLIQLNKQILTLTTTNSEIQIQVNTPVRIKESLSFTLYAKSLIDIIKNLDEDTAINFKIANTKINININNNKFQLNSFNHQDFPLLNQQSEVKSVQIDALALKNLLEKVSFTIANQDIRAYLNGLYIEALSKELTLVSTDGYRLSIGTIAQHNNEIEKETAIIPKKTVLEISKFLQKVTKKEQIEIQLNKNYLQIQFQNKLLISQLINSKYPNYRQVIPQKSKKIIKINRLDFLQALRNINPLVEETSKTIQIKLENSNFDISIKSERGNANSNLKVKTQIIDLTVNFNINYLISALEKLETEQIDMQLPDENNESYLFTNQGKSNYQFIIMPIKI